MTSWNYEVAYGNNLAAVIGGGKSHEDAFANAIHDCLYYAGMGYPNIRISVWEACGVCNGTGRVPYRRQHNGFATLRCKACKGKPEFQKIGPIEFRPHKDVTIDTNI